MEKIKFHKENSISEGLDQQSGRGDETPSSSNQKDNNLFSDKEVFFRFEGI